MFKVLFLFFFISVNENVANRKQAVKSTY